MSPQDRLQAWLAAATLGLRPEVAAAIREEVAAHVEDAMAERGLAGLGSEAALAKAVADLGDPAQSRQAALAAARRPQAGGRRLLAWASAVALLVGASLLALQAAVGLLVTRPELPERLLAQGAGEGSVFALLWLGFHPVVARIAGVLLLGLGGAGWLVGRGLPARSVWLGALAGISAGTLPLLAFVWGAISGTALRYESPALVFISTVGWWWVFGGMALAWFLPALAAPKGGRVRNLLLALGCAGLSLATGLILSNLVVSRGVLSLFSGPVSLWLIGLALLGAAAGIVLLLAWRPWEGRLAGVGGLGALGLALAGLALVPRLHPDTLSFRWLTTEVAADGQEWAGPTWYTTTVLMGQGGYRANGYDLPSMEAYGPRLQNPPPSWTEVPLLAWHLDWNLLLRDTANMGASRRRLAEMLANDPFSDEMFNAIRLQMLVADPMSSEEEYAEAMAFGARASHPDIVAYTARMLARGGRQDMAHEMWALAEPHSATAQDLRRRAGDPDAFRANRWQRKMEEFGRALAAPLYATDVRATVRIIPNLPPELATESVWAGLVPMHPALERGSIRQQSEWNNSRYASLQPLRQGEDLVLEGVPGGRYALAVGYKDAGRGLHPYILDAPGSILEITSPGEVTIPVRVALQNPLQPRCEGTETVWDALPGAASYRVWLLAGRVGTDELRHALSQDSYWETKEPRLDLATLEFPPFPGELRVEALAADGSILVSPLPLQFNSPRTTVFPNIRPGCLEFPFTPVGPPGWRDAAAAAPPAP